MKITQKRQFTPKYGLKSTASGTKVPKTTPMKETLPPCPQGLANTGVPFGLDLPHGPQNTESLQNWDLSTFLVFYVKKDTHLDLFLQGVLGSAIASCDLTLVHVNKRF